MMDESKFKSKSSSPNEFLMAIGLSIYILSGILQPIIIDYLRIHNLLGRKLLLLPTLANTLGMSLCGFVASELSWKSFQKNLKKSQRLKKMVLLTAFVDLLSGMLLTFGMLSVGGAIFVVLYNSCPAWTAMLSKFVLGKTLNTYQIGGVFLVCLGLCMNILGSQFNANVNEHDSISNNNYTSSDGKEGLNENVDGNGDGDGMGNNSFGILFGSIVVLVGSLLHSLMFVLSDMSMNSLQLRQYQQQQLQHQYDTLISSTTNKCASLDTNSFDTDNTQEVHGNDSHNESVPGEIWSCCIGSLETCFMITWVAVGVSVFGFDHGAATNMNASSNIDDESASMSPISKSKMAMCFVGLVFVNAVHACAFFALLKNIGSVASALLKGVQAIVVVGLSALLYCPSDETECLTWSKSISAMVVLSGVLGYGIGSR